MYTIPSTKLDAKTKIWISHKIPEPEILREYIDSDGKIFFGKDFVVPINYLTSDVKYIIFTKGNDIIYPLDNLPNSVLGIIFDNETSYVSNFDNLPNSLIILVFRYGSNFNLPINNLPNSLKKLSIQSNDFNQSVDSLPEFLEELILGKNYNQPINSLPPNLKKLIILSEKKYTINKLPENLLYLNINVTEIDDIINFLPIGLKYLEITCKNLHQINKINFPKLNVLKIKDANKKKSKRDNSNNNHIKAIINNLPDSLLTFELKTPNNNHLIEQIPNSLNMLVLCIDKKFNINNYNLIDKKFIIVSGDIHICDEYIDEADDNYDKNFKSYKINFFN
jgi:hypothetical protein